MANELRLHTADATELTLEVAELGSRSYAFVIDWHIRILLAMAWLFLIWLLMSKGEGYDYFASLMDDEGSLDSFKASITFLPFFAIYFLYHPILETTMQGRTPGKRMAGVRLVDVNGQTPGVAALLIRNLFRLVDSLPAFYVVGCVACMVTRRSVRIGDMAAGTLLVYEEKVSAMTIERAQRVAGNPRLLPVDQEILLDLIDRWKELEQSVRVRLAERFLDKLGESLPAAIDNRTMDQALHLKLLALAGEAPH